MIMKELRHVDGWLSMDESDIRMEELLNKLKTSKKKERKILYKKITRLIDIGAVSKELQSKYILFRMCDEHESFRHGQRVKTGKAIAKRKREEEALKNH